MKYEKQLQVMECLKSGKYKVNGDHLLSYRKNTNTWQRLKHNTLPNGYSQYTLFNSKRGAKSVKVQVYKHIAVYMAHYGTYYPGWQIDHKDRNYKNDNIENLVAKSVMQNLDNSDKSRVNVGDLRTIRAKEIEDIKLLMAEGLSQAAIARKLNLNRLSVRYTMKKLEAGVPLKYGAAPLPSPIEPVLSKNYAYLD